MTKDSSAKRKAGKRKPEKLSFTQDFIPIKNLEHGIIETTDGRYIKILEIEPINFMLRSEEEQYEIICSFASWLKISPVHLQFKSITRKADSDKHIAMLRKETETEESEQCKKLSEGYIRLIKDVGSREALTRRFFLIFRYEELRRNENSDYGQICSTLLTAEQNARAYFMQCGNNILQPKDPDEATAEILYMFFNRRSCVEEPFHSRVDRIVLDTMAAKNKVIGIDPVPHIRMAHFIAPRGIDLTHRNYIIMDGLYYSFLYIKGNGYPNKVRAGWMSSLINAGEGIDVDVFLRRENRSKTIDKVAQRIRLNRTKLKSMQDTSTDYEELAGSIQAGYFIKQGIANYNEDLFYMSVFVTVSARTYEELMWRKQQMTDMLKSMDMYVSDCSFQQEDALRTVMPFLQISLKLEKKSKRNVLTSGAASTYMFTSFEMSDDTGVLLGINRHNNSLCIVDLFDTKKNKNANLNLLGTSGAGKTFTMQLLALRMRMRGIQCYIIAPIKGHEFRRACNRIGGQFIKIAPGSPHCINIMEIRHTISPEMELIDELDYSEMDSLLAQKSLRNRLRNLRNLMPGPRTHGRLLIRCWSTSTASAHLPQSNCRVLRAMLSIEADSSSAILPMIQMMSVQRQRRFSMASMWIRASTAAAANRTTVQMPTKPLQRRAMSVRWTKLPTSWQPWSKTAQSIGAISARPSMDILPSA